MEKKKLTSANGAPVADNNNVATAGKRGPMLLQDVWFLEKLAHFDREVIPERRMHAKGSGAFGHFTVTHDITRYTKAAIFSEIGKQTELFMRFSTVAGERGAADAERDIRGFAIKFYTEEGNWDLVGNNTPVFFLRDPLKFPDLNHVVKRDPRTHMRSPRNNWDFSDSCARSTATSYYHNERQGHSLFLPAYARLRQPYILIYQRRRETHMGEIPLPYPARHQKPHRPRSRNYHRKRPGKPSPRPLRKHRKRRFSQMDDVCATHDRRASQSVPVQSVRPHESMVAETISFARSRCHRTEP